MIQISDEQQQNRVKVQSGQEDPYSDDYTGDSIDPPSLEPGPVNDHQAQQTIINKQRAKEAATRSSAMSLAQMKSNETQIAAANRTTQNLATVSDTPMDSGAIMTDYAQTVSKKDQSLDDEDYSIPQES